MQRAFNCTKFLSGIFLIGIILVFLPGCGYRFGQGEIFDNYQTISIPFAGGDDRGYLTSALVKEISSRTPLRYTACNGDLELCVTFLATEAENIGYRFAPKKSGDLTKIIVAEEARLYSTVCVTLYDRRNNTVLFGPQEIGQSITFDFEPDFSNINFHAFSLGQLEMYPLAEEAANTSLDCLLAEKIVDALIFCW